MKSVDEMYQTYQIPKHILDKLDTKKSVDICLKFPTLHQFLLFNTPHNCFISFYSNFNGIRELFNNENVEINLWAMAKLLSNDNKLPVQKIKTKKNGTTFFLNERFPVNVNLNDIYKQAK